MIYTLFVIHTLCRIITRNQSGDTHSVVPVDGVSAKHVHVRVKGRKRHNHHHAGGGSHAGHTHGSHNIVDLPNPSAPLECMPMKEVKHGENPQLEKDLYIQQTMKALRSSLPVSNNTNTLLSTAEEILRSAPNGQIDAPILDHHGHSTGQTFREAAEEVVNNSTLRAENDYQNMVENGVHPEQARNVAEQIQENGLDLFNNQNKVAEDVRDEVARGITHKATDQLQDVIQRDKVASRIHERGKVEDELVRQHIPELADDTSVLRNLGELVPPSKIVEYMEDAYQNSLDAGLPPTVARAQADRAGSLITDFNSMLRNGESPETALSHLKDVADRRSKIDQRRELIQNSSPEVLKMIRRKDDVIKEALVRTAQDPDCRDKIFNEASQKMKTLDAAEAQMLHDSENNKHIRRPKKVAEDLISQTNKQNAQLVDMAYSHPVVTKDIFKRGIENVEKTAEKLVDHLNAVKYAEQAQNPSAVSALKLLDERKRQDELEKINKRNNESEQKMFQQILKDQEDQQVMQTEEKMAAANKARKILEEGRRAAEDVLKSGGNTEEAASVRTAVEAATARAIEHREAMVEEQILKRLGGAADPDKARRMAAHIAIAHSGENAVGKTPEEVIKKEQEVQKKEILKNAMYNDIGKEPIEIKSVIPESAKEFSIDRSVIKFPLKTFIDEEVTNVGEAYVKNKKQSINEEVRNKITTTRINSGLNVIETKDGFLNIGENSQKIHINQATAYFTPAAKLRMEKKGIKTDNFRSRTNQGELKDMPKGETYYEADLSDVDLVLPSPTNPTPDTLVSNGKDAIDIGDVTAIVIKRGTLIQTPWTEYSDMIKPKFNPYPNEGEKINEIKKLQKLIANEKRKDALDRIKVNTITNPDGEKHMIINTPYGVQEMFEEAEGMKRLSHIDPNKNVAVSETPTEDQKDALINEFKNVPPSQAVGRFIEDTFNQAFSTGHAQRFVNPTNAFTGREDPEKARLMTQTNIDVSNYYINDNKPSSAIKNSLIQNYKALSEKLGVNEEDFIQIARKIPNSSLAQMIAYNEQSESTRPELVDAPFFKTLQPLGNQVRLNSLIKIIFTQISKITGKPNTATGTTLEKKIVPNLKAVKTDQTVTGLNGETSVFSQATAPRKGTTVLSKQITRGLPRVPSGTGSSYPVKSPNPPTNNRSKINPHNQYTQSDNSENKSSDGGVVHNGTTPSRYNISGNPVTVSLSTPLTLPPNSTFKEAPGSQSSMTSLKGNTPVTNAGRVRAGVAGTRGVNQPPSTGVTPKPRPPSPPSSQATPTSPAPNPILGIPSSPLK